MVYCFIISQFAFDVWKRSKAGLLRIKITADKNNIMFASPLAGDMPVLHSHVLRTNVECRLLVARVVRCNLGH